MAQPRLSNFALLLISRSSGAALTEESLGFGWDFSLHPEDGIICLVSSCSGHTCPLRPLTEGDVVSPHLTPKLTEGGSPPLPCPNLQGQAWPCCVGREVNKEKPMDSQRIPDSQLLEPLAVHIAGVNRGQPTAVFGFPIHMDVPGSPSVKVLSQCQDTA